MDDFRLILLAVIVVTGTFAWLAYQDNVCHEKGLVAVRGIIGYECVKGTKP